MGLALHLDVESVGLPITLEAVAADMSVVSVDIDYSDALIAFVDTFLDVAIDLVPVDTGYLQSTIYAETDEEFTADCYADAEYAQYPEYGTWCQDAQPYFRPAVEEAWQEFCNGAIEAIEEAQDELTNILEEIAADVQAEMEEESGGSIGGGIMMIMMMLLLFPLMLYGYGIKQTIADAFNYEGGNTVSAMGMDIEMPEIEIE